MAGICFANFYHGQHIGKGVHFRAAVLLGHFESHEAEFAHFADGADGKFGRFVVFGRNRGNRFLREIPRRLLNHAVFVGDEVKHGKS